MLILWRLIPQEQAQGLSQRSSTSLKNPQEGMLRTKILISGLQISVQDQVSGTNSAKIPESS